MIKYGKYVLANPRFPEQVPHYEENAIGKKQGFTWPYPVLLDGNLYEGTPAYVDFQWIWDVSDPPEMVGPHSHDFDELL